MKILSLLFAAFFIFSPLGYAEDDPDIPAQAREQIRTQTQEMSAAGIPEDQAEKMLRQMVRNRFQERNRIRAQQVVVDAAREGLPPEPLMSKAMEGMAKQAGEQQVIRAMEAVRSRYAYAHRLARSLSDDEESIDSMTRAMADSLAAGMKVDDMDKVMAQLQVRTQQKTQTRNKAEEDKLAVQTMQTVRTMARLSDDSSDVSDTVCEALKNRYTYQEMNQLRHQYAKQTQQASSQQVANQHAGAIGKGGDAGNAGGSGSGPGGGGSGSGPGGGGGSGSGPGGGGSGSGPGGGGAGAGGPGGTK